MKGLSTCVNRSRKPVRAFRSYEGSNPSLSADSRIPLFRRLQRSQPVPRGAAEGVAEYGQDLASRRATCGHCVTSGDTGRCIPQAREHRGRRRSHRNRPRAMPVSVRSREGADRQRPACPRKGEVSETRLTAPSSWRGARRWSLCPAILLSRDASLAHVGAASGTGRLRAA
jgi:hypothetical protein